MMTQTRSAQNQTNQNQTARPAAQTTANAQSAAAVALETKQAPVIEMHDAPYSWNVTVQDPQSGFVEMFTVRAVSFEGFTSRVETMKARLMERNYKPAPTRDARASAAQAQTHDAETQAESEAAPLCGIHGTPMQERTGRNGQKFWSCPQKFANGNYCNYRPPKQ